MRNLKIMHNIEYLIFKYLWIILIMPKYIQMAIISLILIGIIIKNGNKIFADNVVKIFLIFFLINILSVIINSIKVTSIERVLAGINTSLLWLFGSIYYGFFKEERIDGKKIQKYMTINMFILIFLGFFMIICKEKKIVPPTILSRTLYRTDWLNNVKSIRFKGYMEYPNLGVFFYLLCYPFYFEFVTNKKGLISKIFLLIISAIPPILTNSRMGIFGILFLIYIGIMFCSKNKKIRVSFSILIIISTIVFLLTKYQDLYDKAFTIINSRSASTSTRLNIYKQSLSYVINNSIIYGCGIKEMIGNYPLGSHSTYIGILYKTGVLGTLFFLFAFIDLLKNFCQKCFINKKIFTVFLPILIMIIMFTLEDLDGSNWLIIVFFSVIGFYSNKKTYIRGDYNGEIKKDN